MLERFHVAAQDRRQILMHHELRPQVAAVPKHHGEQPHLALDPRRRGELDPELGESTCA